MILLQQFLLQHQMSKQSERRLLMDLRALQNRLLIHSLQAQGREERQASFITCLCFALYSSAVLGEAVTLAGNHIKDLRV